MKKREFRVLGSVEQKGDGNTLVGHIALFNTLSEDLGGFREQLAPGCFTSSLNNEIRALINHDTSACVGNTRSGTLKLTQDEQGLAYELELPDTSAARDLKVSIARGDVRGCSFGFICLSDSWGTQNGERIRTVTDLELFEVSVGVTFPAYADTTSQLRSLFPDGAPEARDMEQCSCDCAECLAGDCDLCSDPDCDDGLCACFDDQERTMEHEENENIRMRIRIGFASLLDK